jgi:hypothetical protein
MANGLPKRVVFKKPRITDKPVDLRAKAEEQSRVKPGIQPEKKRKPIDKSQPEPVKHIEEDEFLDIDIPEEPPQEIIQTKSKRTIIVKREPLPKKQITSSDILVIDDLPSRELTFDEKFLDKMHIKSKITKDTKTQEKLAKPEIKPTVKTKTKEKKKRKFNLMIFVSLVIFILVIFWLYRVMQDYMTDKLDGSLASFMYIAVNILVAIIIFIWFIIELLVENKNEKR